MLRVASVLFWFAVVPLLAQKPVLVGYLPQWGVYGTPPWSARQLVTSGAAAMLDQIDYSQAFIVDGRCAVADPQADLEHVYTAETSVDGTADAPGSSALKGEFHQLQELHGLRPRIRMLISLEGKAASFADAAQPEKRAAFVASCIAMFLRGNVTAGVSAPGLFTGIDVDWEYPSGPGDGANYNALLVEFRRQLDAYAAEARGPRPLLTVAVAPGLGRYQGVDWPLVARTVDRVGLMNYDYNGPWQKMTGLVAPLYAVPGVSLEGGNVDGTVSEYEGAGVPAEKLLMGVPFYGYHWSSVANPVAASAGDSAPNPVSGGAEAPAASPVAQHGLGVSGTSEHGDTPYHEIAPIAGDPRTLFRDARSQAPWVYDGENFWTFDDPVSVAAKAEYAREHGLGGMMIWELSGDTADGVLVKAMRRGLGAGKSSR